ncbi:MAG: rod-binding protein [Brucellaceae bacterium]|nr:rod-binding protein [Brucellaceae bacterium]
MAVQLVTDLVLDVARAADPRKVAEARAALQTGVAAAKTAAADFTAAVTDAAPAVTALPRAVASAVPAKGAAEQFEAYVLQNFVQSMLPADNESVYGKGLAGDMWKSMLAEQIASTMAHDGGVGIANRLLADYTRVEDQTEPVAGVRDASVATAETRAADIVQSYVDEQARAFVSALGNKDDN